MCTVLTMSTPRVSEWNLICSDLTLKSKLNSSNSNVEAQWTDFASLRTEDVLLENMLLTIEPVICEFEPDVEVLEDGWTVRTEDDGRTAQFEHTILVKKTHAKVLT